MFWRFLLIALLLVPGCGPISIRPDKISPIPPPANGRKWAGNIQVRAKAPNADPHAYGMRIDHRPYTFDRKEWTTFLADAVRSELSIRGIRTGLKSAPTLDITCTSWKGTQKDRATQVTIIAQLQFQEGEKPLQVIGSAISPMGPIRATDLATTNLLKTILKHPTFKVRFQPD